YILYFDSSDYSSGQHTDLHSFPTRRSSDLIGLDVGSTTVKLVIIDNDNNLKYSEYRRHRSDVEETVRDVIKEAYEKTDYKDADRSEEHTSELQSRFDLVCRLLLEKKKKTRA